jgi:hypothetical protein
MPKTKEHVVPKVGTVFEKKYRGKYYKVAVVKCSGKTAYDVGGRTFKTPTAAAKSITKHEINGWVFWDMDPPRLSGKKGR